MTASRSLTVIDAERLDNLGFLDRAKSPPLISTADLLSHPVAWILGRPWIGKSTVAADLFSRIRGRSLLPGVEDRVSLTRLGSSDGHGTVPPAWWERWVNQPNPSDAIWLIDGVDEALGLNRHVLEQIVESLVAAPDEHLRRLRFLLFSRPYAELGEVRDRLQRRYGPLTHRTRLLQFWLTRLDRDAAADLVGPDRFNAVETLIRNNHLQSIAGYPVVLNYLKKYQKQTQSLTIPLVWKGVLTALLGEAQSNRVVRHTTTLDERFAAACRIAAVLTLTRCETVREYSPDQQEPAIGILFDTPDNRTFTAAREACQSALFGPSGDPVEYRFVQRNAQDWLTAFALVSLPCPALRSALIAPDRGIQVRMREVARLLRTVSPDPATRDMIEQLSGGVVLPTDAVESSLAEVLRILDRLEDLAAQSPWGLRIGFDNSDELARLRVSGLGDVVRDRLRDPARQARVKDLLIDVAEATRAIEAADAAVELVLDRAQDGELRYAAVWLVSRFGGRDHLAALEKPIGEGDDDSEIECRIRGVLVQTLLDRQIWPCWQVALRTPRARRALIDSRSLLLGSIETRMTLTDARLLLPHFRELWLRHREDFRPHELPEYLTRALELVLTPSPPDPGDLDALTQFVGRVVDDDSGRSVARDVAIRLRPFPSARHSLYLRDIKSADNQRVHSWQLIHPDDWQWLRDQALGPLAGRREVWGHALWAAHQAKETGQLSDADWEAFTRTLDQNAPGLRDEFHESHRQQEEWIAKDAARHREAEARDPARRPLAERVTELLNRKELIADLMRELSWICLVDYTQKRARPGNAWADLPEEVRRKVLDTCCRGLEAATPTPIPADGSFSGWVLAEGGAFAQVIGSEHHRGWLADDRIRKWLPTTLFSRMSGDWAGPITTCRLVSPQTTETALLETIECHVRRGGSLHLLNQIPAEAWTDALTARVVTFISDETVHPAARRELLEQLAKRSPERADPVAAVWAARPVAPDESDHLRQGGRNLLLARNPAAALDLIEADFITRGASALEELSVLWERYQGLEVRSATWPLPLIERLGNLLLWAYPIASDPEYEGGAVPPHRELRDLRGRLLTDLLAVPSQEAASILDRWVALDPKVRERIETYRANEQARQLLPGFDQTTGSDPSALTVHEAVRLLDRAGFRLVRTADDLLDAVMEALVKIQGGIGHDLPMLYSAPDKNDGRKHLQEDALQAYLRRRLTDELLRITEGVEVQIVREDQIGRRQRLDLRIAAPCRDGRLATVVVEIKWSTNRETRSGLVDQLGDRYLLGESLTHGVFLVGWSGTWLPGDGSGENSDSTTLANHLMTQREAYCAVGQPGANLRIEPFVLDARWSRQGEST